MDNDNRKLYPLRFIDEGENVFWGHVSYHLADLGFKDSMIDNGWFSGNTLSELMGTYLERVVGDDVFEFYGLQFPVMLKVMDVKSWQPLQTNASDEAASERYDAYGKTALWYIEEASEDAAMYLGFNRDVSSEEFYLRCKEGSVEDVLNSVHPRKGDSFLIKPGTVFAAGPGLKIIEIAECSELAFNLHCWGQELPEQEELLLDEAFDLIDFSKFSISGPVLPPDSVRSLLASAPGSEVLAHCPEFTVTRINLKDALRIRSEEPGSFVLYHCVSGGVSIQIQVDNSDGTKDVDHCEIDAGHSVLIPSEINDFLLVPMNQDTVMLEILVGKRTVRDSYTSEEVDPNAFGDGIPDPHVREYN